MLKKITLILFVVFFTASTSFAQKNSKFTPEAHFNPDTAAQLILLYMNKVRFHNNVDTLEYNKILSKASALQSANMAENGKADLLNTKGKYKTTGKRVAACGGTKKADELVLCLAPLKGKEEMTSAEFADEVIKKWKSGKKDYPMMINAGYVYAGPSVKMDESGKKVFVSVVLGSFDSFNYGASRKLRKSIKVKYTRKNKKIKAPTDERACKNCEKFKDYEGLIKGLYVANGKVFIQYEDLKGISQLIKGSNDGLAVDIIQRAQYDKNPDYNILNNNLLSKGKLLKTVTKDKLFGKNLSQPEKEGGKATTLDVQLGKLPKKLKGDYELNLLIVQDGKLCKTLTKSYTEQGDQASNTPLTMLLMPDSNAYLKPPFVPKSDTATLNFVVPFEKNKSEYKEEDMLPFLNALEEPDFIINTLHITAYSSIEGDAILNEKLQKKRSESIIQALSKIQKQGAITTVKTSDSWPLFQISMDGGKYDYLSKMKKEEAIKAINSTKGLSEELEPFLAKQRFAEIVMSVSYDISGAKEEKFSIAKFNQAAKKGDVVKAYKIQYYIANQIRAKKYSPEAFSKLDIPKNEKFSGLWNNEVVFHYMANNNIAKMEDYEKLKKLNALYPTNNYISYNYIFCALKLDSSIVDAKNRGNIQSKIDALYKGDVPKKYLDAINIEWQFKIIAALDTVAGSESIVKGCIEKIKSFYNLKESNPQNNLKLAYIFARFNDYRYAVNLLADFVKQDKVSEQVLFAYISYCSHIPDLTKSRLFVTALEKAEKVNHERYCKLFGEPFLTFQVFDNPFVKEDYNKAKCK